MKDEKARTWYEKEAAEQTWAVRTLQRNIDTQYYYRMLSSQHKELVESEMQQNTSGYQQEKFEYLKKSGGGRISWSFVQCRYDGDTA